MTPPPHSAPPKAPDPVDIKALAIVVWRQGFKRETRFKFWHHLFSIIKNNPGVWEHYLSVCAHNEHFAEYRQIVRDEIESQLAEFLANQPKAAELQLAER